MRDITRRRFIKGASLITIGGIFMPHRAFAIIAQEKRLHMHNIHTGETFKGVYAVGGKILPETQKSLDHFLRDWRTGGTHPMSQDLLHLVHDIHEHLGVSQAFDVVSGYRSEKTNQKLRAGNRRVAKNSLHKTGHAIDIKCKGHLQNIRNYARSLKRGGVGYYPRSGFVHVDIREKPTYW
jgi:uncharacterized protein YcbK (DUF882 family)